MAYFLPRTHFPAPLSLPRSYFLGHHASGLAKMKTMLSHIDLILECRDYRVPLTSRNPLFEESLKGRERLVVYTKRDLGMAGTVEDERRKSIIRTWHTPQPTLFNDHKNKKDIKTILEFTKHHARQLHTLMGARILVVGMPNVGKSSLLNALRRSGVKKAKAANTGEQPGITRKIASGVKIVEGNEVEGSKNIYLVDTPGVFVPFVPDAEAMLKLALVGAVKDTIIAPTTLCDYLLYHLNKQNCGPSLYAEYSQPTNDVVHFLEGVCKKTGRLAKGGVPMLDAAALWIVQRWRQGHLGRFILDEVDEGALERSLNVDVGLSVNQARKARKVELAKRHKAKGGVV